MKILVDADACPNKEMILEMGTKFSVPVLFVMDTSHTWACEEAQIITVSKGAEAVDMALINRVEKGDVVLTQDYGLAAMCLSKMATVIHPKGFFYREEEMDELLYVRYLSRVERSKGSHVKGPKRRNKEDVFSLKKCLETAISQAIEQE